MTETAARFLARDRLEDLVHALARPGGVEVREVIAPTVEDGAIVHAPIESAAELPRGVRDVQAPGVYRLEETEDELVFAYAVGPHAWKRRLFPPQRTRLTFAGDDGRGAFDAADDASPSRNGDQVAFLGVRACELAAITVQDIVFACGPYTDVSYASARGKAFIAAVQCTHPASTCFCTSMGTGPAVTTGHDLALTEIEDGFVVVAGSNEGVELLESLGLPLADEDRLSSAQAAVRGAADHIERNNVGVDGSLARRLDRFPAHDRWDEVATRCLACTNCTMVCPTCFCSRDIHTSVLGQGEAGVERQWDSCFTVQFGEVAGGNFRRRLRDRYRHWITHKFSTWWQQFDASGCVGCGRCIAWCPVGIDVREEIRAVTEGEHGEDPREGDPFQAREGAQVRAETVGAGDTPGDGVPEPPPVMATVTSARWETADTVTLTIATPPGLDVRPGQFVMATLPGIGAPPISVSRISGAHFEITVRSVGQATAALCALAPGDRLGISGGYGRGWPVDEAEGCDVIVVGGGIGLAPLRPVLDWVLEHRDLHSGVYVYTGARTPDDMIFAAEMAALELRKDVTALRTVDRAGPDWLGPVGVVTQLLDPDGWAGESAVAFVCGPERMMSATLDALLDAGIASDRIWLTTERHMECGVGLCGHCQLGPFFVCKDGPVFDAAQLGPYLGIEGI